jgi:RsiW-degrading membrane proteinase PrsW (M82 family)
MIIKIQNSINSVINGLLFGIGAGVGYQIFEMLWR